jgi:hypothetical protein
MKKHGYWYQLYLDSYKAPDQSFISRELIEEGNKKFLERIKKLTSLSDEQIKEVAHKIWVNFEKEYKEKHPDD